ncbi:MAG: patatin-like phospholipase family protein [Rhizobiaceae bacterium]|nr:patatin-like phospholipase family protein [Rhizobiaceae bacterium]
MQRYRIGLALGGGAARGWSHIGVIEVLLEAGIRPEFVAGTSIGAIVGGALAAGRFDALKTWALTVDRTKVASLVDVKLTTGGLVEGERIRQQMRDLGLGEPIENLPATFAAVATDLGDGREVWLRQGPLDVAIRASIGLPGIFSPCLVDGRWLVDGGLANQVPVSTCRALGSNFVIAVGLSDGMLSKHADELTPFPAAGEPTVRGRIVDVLSQVPGPWGTQVAAAASELLTGGPRTPSYFSVLANSLNIMQDRITRSRMAGEPPHVMISPHVPFIQLLDFHRAAEAIAAGREAAERALPFIREQLAR